MLSGLLTLTLLLCTVLVQKPSLVAADFPDDPKPCKHGDGECIAKIITYMFQEKNKGYSAIDLAPLEPLRVNRMRLKQGAESAVNIDLKFLKNKIIGLHTVTAHKVTGFGKDISTKHSVLLTGKTISLAGDYTISGKVLILPISGSGKNNLTMVNIDLGMSWMGVPYEKDGETYMKMDSLEVTAEPEKIIYYFGNLFNGDKALGESMNIFLNENWREIFEEVRVNIIAEFAKVFKKVINNVFAKYPYAKYFAD